MKKGTPRKPIPALRWGRTSVPMTDDDATELERRLQAWIDTRGIPHGFVRALLAGDC